MEKEEGRVEGHKDDAKYAKYLIKEFNLWSLFIQENQSYLGRCVIWCKRAKALDLTDATEEEQKELFEVIKIAKDALTKAFNPDWFNYAFLGNETAHLHCHLIPRYKRTIQIQNVNFEDKNWGHNYITDPNFIISEELLQDLKNKIKQHII
eukprot:TRINITY_DN3406_c0_g1_i1.p1 TRINITY_DN3406_c0_g1~~TRINITY_DN3406_c0_g1_i1.p1  ORF type:complete len:151 (+),score=31.32 TRINITY_DN3406_c0_g1_i1:250-702(+)